MTKKVIPNSLFDVWRPDEVAECLPGVPSELYEFIWNELVPLYDGQKRSECNDDFDERCLSKYWGKLTTEWKLKLNELAEKEYGSDSEGVYADKMWS